MSIHDGFLERVLKDSKHRVLALDPGETTGACLFEGSRLIDARQLSTGLMPLAAQTVVDYFNGGSIPLRPLLTGPIDMIVIEDYRVYSWKTDDHAWQGLHTPRLIGAIEYICHNRGTPLTKQSAQQGKGFCTDDKLQAWGLYQKGERHARDAIRHAIYYLLFGHMKIQERK